jgi:hypothetical protein
MWIGFQENKWIRLSPILFFIANRRCRRYPPPFWPRVDYLFQQVGKVHISQPRCYSDSNAATGLIGDF